MVDTDGMDFGSRFLDAQAAFPLSTEFRLARLFKQNKLSTGTARTYI